MKRLVPILLLLSPQMSWGAHSLLRQLAQRCSLTLGSGILPFQAMKSTSPIQIRISGGEAYEPVKLIIPNHEGALEEILKRITLSVFEFYSLGSSSEAQFAAVTARESAEQYLREIGLKLGSSTILTIPLPETGRRTGENLLRVKYNVSRTKPILTIWVGYPHSNQLNGVLRNALFEVSPLIPSKIAVFIRKNGECSEFCSHPLRKLNQYMAEKLRVTEGFEEHRFRHQMVHKAVQAFMAQASKQSSDKSFAPLERSVGNLSPGAIRSRADLLKFVDEFKPISSTFDAGHAKALISRVWSESDNTTFQALSTSQERTFTTQQGHYVDFGIQAIFDARLASEGSIQLRHARNANGAFEPDFYVYIGPHFDEIRGGRYEELPSDSDLRKMAWEYQSLLL